MDDRIMDNIDNVGEDELGKFDDNLHSYYRSTKIWFEKRKPYLRKDFRLIDVAEHIPMCRAYLSKIFNEGFGDSFSNVVKRYRIGEAKRLLVAKPHLTLSEVSEMSGFSSPSSFHRSFAEVCGGITPGEYRREKLKNRDK